MASLQVQRLDLYRYQSCSQKTKDVPFVMGPRLIWPAGRRMAKSTEGCGAAVSLGAFCYATLCWGR
jgi:hypothetical protein